MELFEYLVFVPALCRFLVELKNVDHGLWVFSPFLLRDAALVDQSLPFFGQALRAVSVICTFEMDQQLAELTVNCPVLLS